MTYLFGKNLVILVLHFTHLPHAIKRPFFDFFSSTSFISLLALHLTQYPSIKSTFVSITTTIFLFSVFQGFKKTYKVNIHNCINDAMITVRRLHPTQPSSDTVLKKLHIRFSRPPPQYTLFHVCIVTESDNAHLRTFVSTGDIVEMMVPDDDTNISSLLMSPSFGEWDTSNMEVSLHSEGKSPVRFIPLYSSVETSCAFTPVLETRPEIVKEGLEVYKKTKLATLKYIVGLTAFGSVIIDNTLGEDTAYAFAIGGLTGLGYHMLLQYEMDNLGKNTKQKLIIVNTATRLLFLGCVGATVLNNDPNKIWAIFVGFYINKLALLLAFTI